MATELLQIEPPELTFVFELKKQSSCLVHLINKASHHVAFKVKTTSPKKYCVRPTVGILNPHGTCHFTVIMQAQLTPPPDFHCKDKFLVQSALVPFGTTQDEISSDLFVKDSGRIVDEKKLKVVFSLNQDPPNQNAPPLTVEKGLEAARYTEEDGADKATFPRKTSAQKVGDMNQVNAVVNSTLASQDSQELKSRLSILEAKFREAEGTIMNLNEERRRSTREKDFLKQELEMLKKKIKMKKAQEGFPLLFVCVVSVVSMAVGYYIHQ